jgi:2-dehydro-3-deoxyphosphooctonate aldolase (KDO 8-P synthase)
MTHPKACRIGSVTVGAGTLALIAGPCLAESLQLCLDVAGRLAGLCEKLGVGYVFKSSYDKANRTSLDAARGPGLEEGLEWLGQVGRQLGVPVLADVHEVSQVGPAAAVLDCLQIPAFLCRQTDLLLAAGRSGRAVNIKKGQFVSPERMRFAVQKVRSTGNENVMLTERGASFGYDLLVNDFRAIPIMRDVAPVAFDATHSIQQLGTGRQTGGQRRFVPTLAKAAMAAGADALFIETHPDPASAASDAGSQWPLDRMEGLLQSCVEIFTAAVNNGEWE